MDKITHYIRSVFSLTVFVLNWFKKLIFWKKGHSFKDEDNLLPITVNTSINKSAQFNYSSSSIVNSYNTNINSNWNLINNRHPVKQEDETQEEPNYFEDMNLTPSLTKQKVYIQANNQPQYKEPQYYQSDRLNFDGETTYVQSNELGILEETNDDCGWEEDLDVNADIDENMKMMRQEERERRIAEHKRIKLEKELLKAKRSNNKSNFMATKIS